MDTGLVTSSRASKNTVADSKLGATFTSNTLIPWIYYFENKNLLTGKPSMMTACFRWQGELYGQSYEVPDDITPNMYNIYKKRLAAVVVETLDAIIHHGQNVMDSTKNIHPTMVNDEEAKRFWLDPMWKNKIDAFHAAVLVKHITYEEAAKLKLI